MRVPAAVVGSFAALTLAMPLTAAPAVAASAVKLRAIQYDSPGSDGGSNSSLDPEWVTIKNTGARTKSLGDWTLRDTSRHVYRFPSGFTLGAGQSVRVHTGRGANDRNDLYWKQDWYIWNNTGDKAILRNSRGNNVDTCSWGDRDGTASC